VVTNSETAKAGAAALRTPDSPYAWMRLAAAVAISAIGGVGMWSFVVALPAVQSEFAVDRADASLPFTLTMLGFAAGGVLMGWLADRFGVVLPLVAGALALALGYVATGYAPSLWQFAAAHILLGFGSSATLGPLMADISHWFVRRRGLAVTICSSGNTLAGTVWPPIVQHFIVNDGLRATQIGIGVFCAVTMLPISLMVMRTRAPMQPAATAGTPSGSALEMIGISPGALQGLLCVAGVACCVAMAMPQVHIVAYCSDLGYGVARGADMMAVMMGLAVVSRVLSGVIADRIGGLATLLICSALQGLALFLYLLFTSLTSLYVISGLFGLFQGGLIPMYAVAIREYFSPREVGTRVGIVLMATLFGMAFGGWVSGWIFDLTSSYHAAFINGLLWNFLNLIVVAWLLLRRERQRLALA
jgi:MFS family permease